MSVVRALVILISNSEMEALFLLLVGAVQLVVSVAHEAIAAKV